MSNTMTIDGHHAVIRFNPEISMFRAEFIGLTGGADFYADSVAGLAAEGATALKVFSDVSRVEGNRPEHVAARV